MRPGPAAARLYFLLQAVLVVAWWLWLWNSPAARHAFTPGGLDEASLLAWAPADLLLLAPASLLASLRLGGRAAGQALAWCTTGALAYAAAWCLTASVQSGGGWLASGCMLAAALGSGTAACCALRGRGARRP